MHVNKLLNNPYRMPSALLTGKASVVNYADNYDHNIGHITEKLRVLNPVPARGCHRIQVQSKVGKKKAASKKIATLTLDDFTPDPSDLEGIFKDAPNMWAYKGSPFYRNAFENVSARLKQLHKHPKSKDVIEKIAFLLSEFEESNANDDVQKIVMMVLIAPIDQLLHFYARGEVEVTNSRGEIISCSVKSYVNGKVKVGYWKTEVTDEVFKYDRSIHGDLKLLKGNTSEILRTNIINMMSPVLEHWQNTLRETLIELSRTEVPDDIEDAVEASDVEGSDEA